MEENTIFDFNGGKPNAQNITQSGIVRNDNGLFTGHDDNAIARWWNPEIAEQAQFDRENYFVDKANAFNEYMWNKQNEYNTPEAQMTRMKAAGINPLLAAAGIAGNGNTAAPAAAGAQGSSEMNTSTINPIESFTTLAKGLQGGIAGANELGKIIGFGKENKATINQINQTANKAAEEADFTFWQKRQFRRTMRIMYDQAEKNLEQTEANIKVLQETFEKYQQEKFNIAADTNLKTAETGQTLENTKNIAYKNAEEEFKKIFREIFGVQLNESDMSMLVQAVLGGHGKAIINGITDAFSQIIEALSDKVKGSGNNIITNAQARFEKWKTDREQRRKFKEDGNERREQIKTYKKNAEWIWEHSATARKKYKDFKEYFYNEYLPKKGIGSYVPN